MEQQLVIEVNRTHMRIEHPAPVHSVAFSPDGQILASGSEDGTVRLWLAADGTLLRTLEGHTDSVLSVAFSPNGQTLASGLEDKTVRLWRATGKPWPRGWRTKPCGCGGSRTARSCTP